MRRSREARAERLARGDAQAARRRARARDDVVAGLGRAEADRFEARDDVADARLRHVADHEVLVLRRAHVVEAVRAHQRGERSQLVGRQVAEADRHGDGDEAVLLLLERLARRARARRLADDRRAPFLRRQRRGGVRRARALELLVESRDEAFDAEALDQELDAGLRALGAVRVLLVQLDHRFHRRRRARPRARTRARRSPRAACGPGRRRRRSLKPGSPSLRVAMTPRSCSRPCAQSRSQPEKLILNLRGSCWVSGLRMKCRTARSRCWLTSVCSSVHAPAMRARRDVADRVVAGFARREARAREDAHRLGRVVERDRVDLDRLARRDVRLVGLRPGVDDLGDRVELGCVELAARRLDAQHVDARLALAVGAHLQPHRREPVLGDRARAEGGDRRLVAVDLVEVGERAAGAWRQDRSVAQFGMSVGSAHRNSPMRACVREGQRYGARPYRRKEVIGISIFLQGISTVAPAADEMKPPRGRRLRGGSRNPKIDGLRPRFSPFQLLRQAFSVVILPGCAAVRFARPHLVKPPRGRRPRGSRNPKIDGLRPRFSPFRLLRQAFSVVILPGRAAVRLRASSLRPYSLISTP